MSVDSSRRFPGFNFGRLETAHFNFRARTFLRLAKHREIPLLTHSFAEEKYQNFYCDRGGQNRIDGGLTATYSLPSPWG